jgi:hypothetical protein
MTSYNNMQPFKYDCAWVIFDQGEVHLYGPDGAEVSKVKNITLTIDADNYPDVKANILVNVGTLDEMNAWIAKNKEI